MLKRPTVLAFAALLVAGSSVAVLDLSANDPTVYACINSAGTIQSTRQGTSPQKCAHSYDRIIKWKGSIYRPVATTTVSPTTQPTTTPTTKPIPACVGVPLVDGQRTIDANPTGTTYCLSGTHNWTLIPKTGDQILSDPQNPGILDGEHTTQYAIMARIPNNNVVIENLEIRNYVTQSQRGAIVAVNDVPSNWTLRNLQVHNNGSVGIPHPDADGPAGGAGANVGPGWKVLGGRYYNNRQTGLGGGGASGAVIDGVELDHNNFTDNNYTTKHIDCGFEAGGFKWALTSSMTIKNSKIHDNACKGLWADINTSNNIITNNEVYNNWDEGIFIEISTGAKISYNNVYGNGHHSVFAPDCTIFLWGGGISLAASNDIEIFNNIVSGNCMGIVGIQQNRPDGNPGLLKDINIHDNQLIGPKNRSGVVADNGADLTTRNIVWTNNTFTNGASFCGYGC